MNTLNTRQQAQLAFIASNAELEVGHPDDCPLPLATLATTNGSEDYVSRVLSGGLTAHVYRIEAQGRSWTLKRARERCLVQNTDGQTSFLNEVQRRADLRELKRDPILGERLVGIVDTCYGSFRQGVLLSPWIEGEPIAAWNERQLTQLFEMLVALLLGGCSNGIYVPAIHWMTATCDCSISATCTVSTRCASSTATVPKCLNFTLPSASRRANTSHVF